MHEQPPAPRLPDGAVTISSYNIHRCVGTDGVRDPERVAAVIDELASDVVALQEVEGAPGPDGVLAHLALLARATGLVAVPGPTLLDSRGSYGNAILTRYPVLAIRQIDLSVPLREPRGAVAVDLGVGFGTVRVVGIHLGLQAAERRAQVERLLSELPAGNVPLVVAGDFNEWLPGSNVIRRLRARFDQPPAVRTFPSWRPLLALDRIFAEPTTALREVALHRSILSRVASDHLPVRASIRA